MIFYVTSRYFKHIKNLLYTSNQNFIKNKNKHFTIVCITSENYFFVNYTPKSPAAKE